MVVLIEAPSPRELIATGMRCPQGMSSGDVKSRTGRPRDHD
jgi:hypothetical protein